MKRREFIAATSLLLLFGCESEFRIKPAVLRLGKIRDLLSPVQKVSSASMMVFRDENGWRALSARCSLEGCDLSYFNNKLFCPCCKSLFDLRGFPIKGRAKKRLPWFAVGLKADLQAECRKLKCRGSGKYYPDIFEGDKAEVYRGADILDSNIFAHTGIRVPENYVFKDELIEKDLASLVHKVQEEGPKAAEKEPFAVQRSVDVTDPSYSVRGEDYQYGAGKEYDIQ